MAEYIEREAAVKAANEWVSEACMASVMRVSRLFDKLQKVPAADVAPVVRTRWAHLGGDEWCCPVCGFVLTTEGSWDKPIKKYCEDTGLMPAEVHSMYGEWCAMMSVLNGIGSYERLRELAEADKDERLVVLPCKVGDTVWANLDGMRHTRKCVIEFANIGSHVTTIVFSTVDGLREQYGVNPISFGKTVFLTREEAEKALEGMKDG